MRRSFSPTYMPIKLQASRTGLLELQGGGFDLAKLIFPILLLVVIVQLLYIRRAETLRAMIEAELAGGAGVARVPVTGFVVALLILFYLDGHHHVLRPDRELYCSRGTRPITTRSGRSIRPSSTSATC